MKRIFLPVLLSAAVMLAGATLFSACTKEGPKGPAGEDGADGNSATCAQCHNLSDDLVAKIGQYDASTHALGGNNDRNLTTCAPCHTSQGFIECVATGANTTSANISNPASINCRTCHPIHSTYTSADYSLRFSSAFAMRVDGDQFNYGKGNLCAKCHQGLAITYPMDSAVFHLTSSVAKRFGYHHSPVANLFAGVGGIEIPGLESYNIPNKHRNVPDACITCHMDAVYGYKAGGHQMGMTYDSDGTEKDNIAACTTCHPGLGSFNNGGVQTSIEGLLSGLETKLINLGIMDSNYYGQAGTWTYNQLGAFINFNMCREDKSLGVHNPTYIHALLQNSYDALP